MKLFLIEFGNTKWYVVAKNMKTAMTAARKRHNKRYAQYEITGATQLCGDDRLVLPE